MLYVDCIAKANGKMNTLSGFAATQMLRAGKYISVVMMREM